MLPVETTLPEAIVRLDDNIVKYITQVYGERDYTITCVCALRHEQFTEVRLRYPRLCKQACNTKISSLLSSVD